MIIHVRNVYAIYTGLFFIIPCMDDVKVIDLRTVTFDVPPQEVCFKVTATIVYMMKPFLDSDKGQCYSPC